MLDNDLLNIKASGYYFLEYDKSKVIQQQQTNRLPLVPIVTKKGPINNPVYIGRGDMNTFRNIFGDRDRTQEINGNFSYLSAEYILRTTPAVFLNLRYMDDTLDLAQKVSFSTNFLTVNKGIATKPYTSLLNTHRFWFADTKQLIRATAAEGDTDVLQFGNIGTQNMSIFVVKSRTNVRGYDVTVGDYYTARGEEYPRYLHKTSKMKDYLVDVYFFRKDLTTNASNDTNYGYLFNSDTGSIKKNVVLSNGTKSFALDVLSNIRESEFVAKYTGALIPTAQNERGQSIAIDTVINRDISIHKVICALNEKTIESTSDWESILAANSDAYHLGGQPLELDLTGQNILSGVEVGTPIDATNITVSNVSIGLFSYDFSVNNSGTELIVVDGIKGVLPALYPDLNNINAVLKLNKVRFERVYNSLTPTVYSAVNKTNIYVNNLMPHTVGEAYFGVDGRHAYITKSEYIGIERILEQELHTSELPLMANGTVFPKSVDGDFVYPVGHPDVGELVEYSGNGLPLDGVSGAEIPMPTLTNLQYATILTTYGVDRNIYKCQLDKDLFVEGQTSVTVTPKPREMTLTLKSGTTIDVFSNTTTYIFHIPPIDSLATGYVPTYLESYKIRAQQFPNGTAERQNDILNVMVTPKMLSALMNKDVIDYRYVVDSFKTYLEENAKSQFGILASTQKLSFAVVNEPFTDDIIDSEDPYFSTTVAGDYDVIYYKTGGNTNLPYSKLYRKPGRDSGNSYMGSFQCFYRGENGRIAPFVSSAIVTGSFLEKLRNGIASDAVMGTTYAITAPNILGPDNDYDDTERGELELYGMNTIVKKDGIIQIYNNTTCQYTELSAMSYTSNRELVIELRRQIIPLLNYLVGKTNSPQLRLYAKTELDKYCQRWLDAGALVRFENVVDITNNTPEVIENAYAILDTQLWFSGKMQKVVHRATYNSSTNDINFSLV